ncbi:MAG: ABC transporter substrate-binding protein [Gemmatimonadota bacterium]|nr:ABC transporter substrate-binding protein [Gemmatimonadota bacterium]
MKALALLLFLVPACCGPVARQSAPPSRPAHPLEDQAWSIFRQGVRSFEAGDFSASRISFDRVLDLCRSAENRQLVFLGVYYGVRSRLASGRESAADSLFDQWQSSLPEGQVTELEWILGRTSQEPKPYGDDRFTGRTLGIILPLSGKFAEFGAAILEGIKLAVQEFNQDLPEHQQALLKVLDDASDQIRAASLGRELAADSSVVALIGSHGDETSIAIGLVASAMGVPLVCPIASAPGMDHLGPMVHIINRTDPELAETLAVYAVDKLGLQTFAILAPDDDYGSLLTETFSGALAGQGAVVVASQTFNSEAKSLESQMNIIGRYMPDAIYLPAHSNAITQIAAQVYYYGLNDARLLGTEYWNNERVIRMGGEYVDGAVFAAPFFQHSPLLRWGEFKDLYESVFLRPVNRYSALGYDATGLLLSAAVSLPIGRNRLAGKLNSIEGHPGVMGVYDIEPGGLVRRQVFMLGISGGSIVPAQALETQADSLEQTAPPGSTPAGQNQVRPTPTP